QNTEFRIQNPELRTPNREPQTCRSLSANVDQSGGGRPPRRRRERALICGRQRLGAKRQNSESEPRTVNSKRGTVNGKWRTVNPEPRTRTRRAISPELCP